MRLTDRTDFALRVLMLLAVSDDRRTVAEMAERLCVSAHHLSKVVQGLQERRWVRTTRGREGGVELSIDPAELTVGDVVRAVEPDLALVACLQSGGSCPVDSACALRGALMDARDAFLNTLDSKTLESLVRGRKQRLVALLIDRAS